MHTISHSFSSLDIGTLQGAFMLSDAGNVGNSRGLTQFRRGSFDNNIKNGKKVFSTPPNISFRSKRFGTKNELI